MLPVQTQQGLIAYNLPRVFKISKPVSWDAEIRWGLNSLVAAAKKGVQNSETPLVEQATEVTGKVLQRCIEGTHKSGIASAPEIVDNQLYVERQLAVGYGLELITDLVTHASRVNEAEPIFTILM